MHKEDRLHKTTKIHKRKQKLKAQKKHDEADHETTEICNFCNVEFRGTSVLKSHIAKEHPQTTASVADQKEAFTLCVLCPATFNSRVELRIHKKNEHRDQEFPCSQCNWTGDTPNSLQNHRNNVCRAQGVFWCTIYVVNCPQTSFNSMKYTPHTKPWISFRTIILLQDSMLTIFYNTRSDFAH